MSWDTIDRHLAGNSTPEEAQAVQAYLASHALTEPRVKRALQHADGVADQAPRIERTWQTLVDRLELSDAQPHTTVSRSSGRHRQRGMPVQLWRVSASAAVRIALVCTVVAGALIAGRVAMSRVGQSPAQSLERVYTTAAGQQATVTLADGSRVNLAPQSRLMVVGGFGNAARTVTLAGEAYFDIKDASDAPFVVRAGSVATRVLGTAFDVRHYPSDSTVRIAVVSGKVAASGRRASVTLSAGAIAHVTDSTATSTVVSDLRAYTDWTQGRLVFEDVPASAMLAALGQWYGYEFRVADSSMAARHVSAVVNVMSRVEAMTIIKHLLGVTMTFDGNVVTLRPRREGAGSSEVPRRNTRVGPLLSTEVGK